MASECRKCGLQIAWKQTESGKWCPTNPDGSDHWDICRAQQFANSKRRVTVGELEFVTEPRGRMPQVPDDGLPPWDESIVPDWSWCRGWRVVRAGDAYRKTVDPKSWLEQVKRQK